MQNTSDQFIELSIVMPCLNEAETLEICIQKAQNSMHQLGIRGEVVIADNGSTDGSQQLASAMGARVVPVADKGYGNALMGGIRAATGRYVIMGDADDSYAFDNLMPFIEKLREGYDLVMGNRFKGGIKPGAMPPLHRYLGNPVLSAIGRVFFHSPCGDFHCGLRGFNRQSILGLNLQTTGMEFASEMVIKATLNALKICEVPTVLSPDGRSRPPHLRSWRDGWRHLRFMLLYSPRWLFLYPGIMLMIFGVLSGLLLICSPVTIGRITFDVHTLLISAVAVLIGFQSVLFAVLAKIFGIREGYLPPDRRLERLFRYVTLESGLIVGVIFVMAGFVGCLYAIVFWGQRAFGNLDPTVVLRILIPSVTALSLGIQIILSSFFLSLLGMPRRSSSRTLSESR